MEQRIYQILNILLPIILGMGVLLQNKAKRTLYYLLAGFFVYSGLNEWMGMALLKRFDYAVNIFFYNNFSIPISYLMQFLLFYLAIPNLQFKKVVVGLTLCYLSSFAADKIWLSYQPNELNMLSYSLGSVACIVVSLLYLYSLVQDKRILHFRSDLFFWIAVGSLFFQLFTFVFYTLMGVWKDHQQIGLFFHNFSMVCLYISYLIYAAGIRWMTKR